MEETIGYEALFSDDEWISLEFGEWTDDFDPDGSKSPSGVTLSGDGSAAPSQAVTSEGCISHSLGPSLDTRAATSCDKTEGSRSDEQGQEPKVIDLGLVHEVSCRQRELIDGTTEYVLECEICEEIGTADTYEEADAIAQLHRTFVTDLVDRWEV